MSNITELSKNIRISYEYDESAKRHIQMVTYHRECVAWDTLVLLKASSSMGPLSYMFLLDAAFGELAFFIDRDLEENKGKADFSPQGRAVALHDLSTTIQSYQHWDVCKEHTKGSIDHRIIHDFDNIDVLVVPYIQKEKLWSRHGDVSDRYGYIRKVMLKVKVLGAIGTNDNITREFAIGDLFGAVKPVDYQAIIKDIVTKYHLDDVKE